MKLGVRKEPEPRGCGGGQRSRAEAALPLGRNVTSRRGERYVQTQLQPRARSAVAEGQHRDVVEDRVLVVGALQVVVGDLGAEVVDVVKADVAGEELEELRQLQVGAALQRGVGVAPVARELSQ